MLDPSIKLWDKFCICKKPLNPDHLYIKCDKCENWYHPKHCGISDEDAEVMEEFICDYCK